MRKLEIFIHAMVFAILWIIYIYLFMIAKVNDKISEGVHLEVILPLRQNRSFEWIFLKLDAIVFIRWPFNFVFIFYCTYVIEIWCSNGKRYSKSFCLWHFFDLTYRKQDKFYFETIFWITSLTSICKCAWSL